MLETGKFAFDTSMTCLIKLHDAQLIFNTHNPIFLNSNIFRRDEIKFVESEEDTNNSILYALSDFLAREVAE